MKGSVAPRPNTSINKFLALFAKCLCLLGAAIMLCATFIGTANGLPMLEHLMKLLNGGGGDANARPRSIRSSERAAKECSKTADEALYTVGLLDSEEVYGIDTASCTDIQYYNGKGLGRSVCRAPAVEDRVVRYGYSRYYDRASGRISDRDFTGRSRRCRSLSATEYVWRQPVTVVNASKALQEEINYIGEKLCSTRNAAAVSDRAHIVLLPHSAGAAAVCANDHVVLLSPCFAFTYDNGIKRPDEHDSYSNYSYNHWWRHAFTIPKQESALSTMTMREFYHFCDADSRAYVDNVTAVNYCIGIEYYNGRDYVTSVCNGGGRDYYVDISCPPDVRGHADVCDHALSVSVSSDWQAKFEREAHLSYACTDWTGSSLVDYNSKFTKSFACGYRADQMHGLINVHGEIEHYGCWATTQRKFEYYCHKAMSTPVPMTQAAATSVSHTSVLVDSYNGITEGATTWSTGLSTSSARTANAGVRTTTIDDGSPKWLTERNEREVTWTTIGHPPSLADTNPSACVDIRYYNGIAESSAGCYGDSRVIRGAYYDCTDGAQHDIWAECKGSPTIVNASTALQAKLDHMREQFCNSGLSGPEYAHLEVTVPCYPDRHQEIGDFSYNNYNYGKSYWEARTKPSSLYGCSSTGRRGFRQYCKSPIIVPEAVYDTYDPINYCIGIEYNNGRDDVIGACRADCAHEYMPQDMDCVARDYSTLFRCADGLVSNSNNCDVKFTTKMSQQLQEGLEVAAKDFCAENYGKVSKFVYSVECDATPDQWPVGAIECEPRSTIALEYYCDAVESTKATDVPATTEQRRGILASVYASDPTTYWPRYTTNSRLATTTDVYATTSDSNVVSKLGYGTTATSKRTSVSDINFANTTMIHTSAGGSATSAELHSAATSKGDEDAMHTSNADSSTAYHASYGASFASSSGVAMNSTNSENSGATKTSVDVNNTSPDNSSSTWSSLEPRNNDDRAVAEAWMPAVGILAVIAFSALLMKCGIAMNRLSGNAEANELLAESGSLASSAALLGQNNVHVPESVSSVASSAASLANDRATLHNGSARSVLSAFLMRCGTMINRLRDNRGSGIEANELLAESGSLASSAALLVQNASACSLPRMVDDDACAVSRGETDVSPLLSNTASAEHDGYATSIV